MYQPELRPSPGRQEESPGQVVDQRWFRCGLICHQARLAFGSTVQRTCACATAVPAKIRDISSAVKRFMSTVLSPALDVEQAILFWKEKKTRGRTSKPPLLGSRKP